MKMWHSSFETRDHFEIKCGSSVFETSNRESGEILVIWNFSTNGVYDMRDKVKGERFVKLPV